jgi:DNA-binding HxlR family transcriptional regulator
VARVPAKATANRPPGTTYAQAVALLLGFREQRTINCCVDEIERIRRIVTGCSLDAALEAIGERWSFLILRGAFNGLRHFEQFQAALGIARNVLANRLMRLVKHGILERTPCADDRRKVEYRLTEKGEALMPTVIALRQWGERWAGGNTPTSQLVDNRDEQPICEVVVRAHDGRTLHAYELHWTFED